MLFITNRFPKGSIKTEIDRPFSFDLNNNAPSNSVYFCERQSKRKLVEVGRLHRLSGVALTRRILLPAALPSLFTGLRGALAEPAGVEPAGGHAPAVGQADAVDLGAADCAQVECEGGGSDLDRIASAVAASCAVPGLFAPVEIDGAHYYDGGLVHSIPVGRAIALGATEIHVLQVGRVEQLLSAPTNPLDVGLVAFEIARRHRFVEEIAEVPDSVRLHVLPSEIGRAHV